MTHFTCTPRLLTTLTLASALCMGWTLPAGAQTAAPATAAQPHSPAPAAMAPAAAMATAPSLYQALGEKAGIRAVMDDLVQRLATDPRTASLFTDTNRAQLASQLTDQSCQLTGGPCTYKGPDMKTAHEDMKLTQAHFNALVEMAQQAMSAQGVPFATQNRLLALLAPMHRDVVTVH